MKQTPKGIVVLCVVIAVAVGAASAVGVFLRGGGDTESIVSPRGEEYEMVTNGVYRYNSQRLVAEGIGWDIVTLFVAVPVFLAALPGLAKGRLGNRLLAVGMLAYFFYQYLMYAVTWAFGPLFLLFVFIYGASIAAGARIVAGIDVSALPARFTDRFPARGMSVFSIVMALILVGMWLGRIIPAMGGQIQGLLVGQTTLVVQALDLGIIVPLAFFTGVVTWRRKPIGFLLAPIFIVKGAAMALAISAMVISAWIVEGEPQVPPLVLFGAATAVAVWLGIRIYRSVRDTAATTRQ